MIHSSHRDRKAKAIAEVLAMIDADLPLAPHRPSPVLETDEWLFESATEFIEGLERTIDRPSFRHSLSSIGHLDFLNTTQFAGFLASSQGMPPARSRRKTPHNARSFQVR